MPPGKPKHRAGIRRVIGASIPICLGAVLLSSSPAQAQDIGKAQQAQLEVLRREVAGEIQLAAFNLVDELVYGWTQTPIFGQPTDVVLAGVSVPVGLGTALQALLENHIHAVLLKNPSTKMVLTHCPACTAMLVHSGPQGTIISRGVDNPAAFARVQKDTATRHALFIDVEAEGSWLVLRARLTKLDRSLPIVWARTISSAGSAPSLLRQSDDIKSAKAAREELMDAVHDRWPLTIPAKISVRLFEDTSGNAVAPPPFIWLQSGVELALGQARAWTASILFGYGYVPSSFDGVMAQVRIHRLVTGTSRSFTRPDIYLFGGASIIGVRGASALIFRRGEVTTEDILALAQGNNAPLQAFSSLHAGVEARIGNRLGISLVSELLPAHLSSDNNLGLYFGLFHSIGTEVSVWF